MVRLSAAWGMGALALVAGCSPSDRIGPPEERPVQVETPIVGGVPDTTTKGVVALTTSFDGVEEGFCSGALLAPNLVLTARHCVAEIRDEVEGGVDCNVTNFGPLYDYEAMNVSIEDDITDGAEASLLFGMADVVVPLGNDVCSADIALVILDGQGIPSTLAQTFEPALAAPPVPNEAMVAIGYGIQDPDDEYGTTFGRRMRFDDGSVYCLGGTTDCAGYAEPREFIADAPTCSGDSGGPGIDGDNRVIGVVSRGDALCSIAIYTEVSAFAPLIRATALDAAELGGYPPPSWAGEPLDPPDGGAPEPDGGSLDAGVGGGTSAPDSGTSPDSGAEKPPAPGGPGDGGLGTNPSVDPLGLSCNGDCPGNYACYAASGEPPGICVPYCGAGLPACPGGYACSKSLKACVPYEDDDDGSCAVSAAPSRSASSAFGWVLISALLLAGARRRR